MSPEIPIEMLPPELQKHVRTFFVNALAPQAKTVKLIEQDEPISAAHLVHDTESEWGVQSGPRRLAVSTVPGHSFEVQHYRGREAPPAAKLLADFGPWFILDLVRVGYGSKHYASVRAQKGTIDADPLKRYLPISAPLATYLYILSHIRAGGHYRSDAFEAADYMFKSKTWREAAFEEGASKGLFTAHGRLGQRIIGLTPIGRAIGSRIPESYHPRYNTTPKDFLGGMRGSTLGAMASSASRFPGYVSASSFATVVDSGSFTNAGLAKAGIEPVTQSLSMEGKASTQPLGFEDYEAKFCQALKGGGNPPCRVHLSSTNGQMAVRLCDKLNEPGTVIPVKNAHEALQRSREFCKCARNKPDGVRKKCARKMAGAH